MTTTTFSDIGLEGDVLETLNELGYETPTEIQARSIPLLLEGQNLLGIAQTGTGKTAAFTLPLLQNLDPNGRDLNILVLAPTRELGQQVAESFEKYAAHRKSFKVACLYGGQDVRIQLTALKKKPQVVVATPGRLIDLLDKKKLNLDSLSSVVLDEADEMLRMGFEEDVKNILSRTQEGVQMALFSATMPNGIRNVAETYLNGAEEVRIRQEVKTVDNIQQRYLLVGRRHKMSALERIIEGEEADAGIIFVKTRQQTLEVAEHLKKSDYRVAALNGDLMQNMRENIIRQLKQGVLDWIVATDVAARGLDVTRITHVVNYDIPFDHEAYVHRIGRTGRAGRSGTAILMISRNEMRSLQKLEAHTGATITPMPIPGGKEISDQRIKAFKENLLKICGQVDLKRMKKLIEEIGETHSIDDGTLLAALAHLAQEERPLFPKLDVIPEEKAGKMRPLNDKGGKGKSSFNQKNKALQPGWQRFRLAIGREHRLNPGDIVGAFANEGGIPSEAIGNIQLYSHYSTVDLPHDTPNDVINGLRNMRIRNNSIQMRPWEDREPSEGDRPRKSSYSKGFRGQDGKKKGKFNKPFRSRKTQP
jgi:ATP-dependent RNA helicase DeaD